MEGKKINRLKLVLVEKKRTGVWLAQELGVSPVTISKWCSNITQPSLWNIADDVLRDVFLRGQYRDVILPMVVLRRLDALLEPTKEEVEAEITESGIDNIDEGVLKDITGLSYFNTSKWTLNRLKSQASDNNDILYDNFIEYLNGYSENIRDVLRNFEYYTKARKLADNDRLLSIIERITDPRINLTDKNTIDPDGLPMWVWELSLRNCFVDSMRKITRKRENTLHQEMRFLFWRIWSLNP